MRAFVALVIFLSLFKVSSLFAAERVSASLDIDGNGQYDALTDGLLIVRYLFGLTDSSLTNGTLGSNATRTEPSQIVSLLDSMKDTLDIDGNTIDHSDSSTVNHRFDNGVFLKMQCQVDVNGNAIKAVQIGSLDK